MPLTAKSDLPRLVTAFEGRCKAIRHQWAVAGGTDSAGKTDRLGTFKGFLRQALEQGDFP